jgi:hypothetical protein
MTFRENMWNAIIFFCFEEMSKFEFPSQFDFLVSIVLKVKAPTNFVTKLYEMISG